MTGENRVELEYAPMYQLPQTEEHSMNEKKPLPNYAFFCHKACEYFPCHKTKYPEEFNCLFCYCPLYTLGPNCGGNFRYTEKGIKSCMECMLPHSPAGYQHIISKYPEIAELARKKS